MKVTLFNLESIFHVILYLIIALAASHPPPPSTPPCLFPWHFIFYSHLLISAGRKPRTDNNQWPCRLEETVFESCLLLSFLSAPLDSCIRLTADDYQVWLPSYAAGSPLYWFVFRTRIKPTGKERQSIFFFLTARQSQAVFTLKTWCLCGRQRVY